MQPLIRLENAGLRHGARWVVRNITLQVHPGEIVTLIGPNGSGKSTTARLALGIARLSAGQRWCKPDIRVGYMPQRMDIDWTLPLTVRRFMRLTNSLADAQLHQALASTGAEQLGNAQMSKLSGGELQRVLLARTLARQPDLLVLDEPVQGVDIGGEIAIYNLIAQIRDTTNCGILLISHDLHIVMSAADHVVCINGHICCEGEPSSVVNHAMYRQLFGDKAAILAPYQHHHNHVHAPDGKVVDNADAEN